MKGIIFAGCSFTHGHGLWFYSNLKTQDCIFTEPSYDSAVKRYISSKRFARLVSNHFDTWEFVRDDYSGDDENSVGIINHLFEIDSPIQYTQQNNKFNFDDISHLIFQTSFIDRCSYILDDTLSHRVRITEIEDSQQVDTLIEWGFTNIEDYYTELRKQWYSQIRDLFKILESNNIKCYMLSITDDYLNLIENDDFMKDKFIEIGYDDKKFKTITELFDYDKTLIIKNDSKNLENPPMDNHPSLKCHEIIAKSIIDKIEKNG